MPSAALAAMQDSPPPLRRLSLRSPLPNGRADFELGHSRTPLKRAPPDIEIPSGGGDDDAGYTSIRDILSSPQYAGCSPAATGGGYIHMIRHPLVKHAAYAYLQMTPSGREDPTRRSWRRRWRGLLCRLLGCFSFIGALFRT